MIDITAFEKPLKSELHKKYIEQLAFLLLKHIFPEIYSDFILSDAPDLQDQDHSVGIEITEAIAEKTAQIGGEYTKLRFGRESECAKKRCRELIEKNGGEVDEIRLSYPVTNSSEEWDIFANALRNKLKLLPSYRKKGFNQMGLFILFDEPPIPFNPEVAMQRFAAIQENYEDRYDFLFFGYHNAVIVFDFGNMKYEVHTIAQDTFNALMLHAKKLVEK